MKILVANQNDPQRQLLVTYFENIFDDIEIVQQESITSAIKMLETNTDYDLIISSNVFNNENVVDLFTYVKHNCATIPFILASEEYPEMIKGMERFKEINQRNTHILLPINLEDFKKVIINILRPHGFKVEMDTAFQKIKIAMFYRFNKVLCPVYLQLSKRKYIKVINQNDVYSKLDIDKIKAKGVEYLHIKTDDFMKFQVSLLKASFLTSEAATLVGKDLEEMLARTHAILQDLLLSVGMSETTIRVAEKNVNDIIEQLSKADDLKTVFDRMSSRMDYLYDHSYLTAMVCTDLVNKMKIKSDAIIKQLCMASIFHDITLKDPALALIEDKDDPKLQDLDEKSLKEYLWHPFHAADLICDKSFVPFEVGEVIRQHHERADGKGFPNQLGAETLSLLVCTFLIAHDYINLMYKVDFDQDKQQVVISQLRNKFQHKNFLRPLDALCGESS